jgi:hypothetical protein
MAIYPEWFDTLSWSYLGMCLFCALVMLADEAAGNRQHRMIMNLVWPITALYWGPAAPWGYFTAGRKMTHKHMGRLERQQQIIKQKTGNPQRGGTVAERHGGEGVRWTQLSQQRSADLKVQNPATV